MDIKLVTNCDDWQGLYIDGKLITEGHSISLRDFADAVGVEYDRVEVSTAWLGRKVGNLPATFDKVPKKYIIK